MSTVELTTSKGVIQIELDEANATVTTENFLAYVNDGFFDGTIFHRVIPNFMVQGGGFVKDMTQKPTKSPIKNEADNGLSNDRGTVAMARTNDPESATAQFFINIKDNAFLNYSGADNPGYAVFGKVTEGMDVADEIVSVDTTTQNGMQDVPAEAILIHSAKVL
jgi:cyclophilin family peptidyl-prolyl cis-trans isomerase